MQRQAPAGDWVSRRLARRRRADRRRSISAPSTSWPRKPTKPSRSLPGLRLGDVVEEGAEAQRGAAAHLVGERLGEQRRPASAARSPAKRARSRLDLQRVLEHRERVAVDVEVVVRALFDARAGPSSSGRTTAVSSELVEQREAAQRVGTAEQLAQLGQLALAGGLGGARGARPGERDGRRGRSRGPSSAARRGGAQQPQRVLRRSCARRPRAGCRARGRRGRRRGRSARRRPAARRRRRREVALGRGRPRSTRRAAAVTSTCQPRDGGDHAPGAELGGELEGVLAELARRAPWRPAPGSPATARSRSATSRPSAASRTAPPTIQTPSAPPSAADRGGRRAARRAGRRRGSRRPAAGPAARSRR